MVPMLRTFICTMNILWIFHKIFHCSDVQKALGLMLRLEDSDQTRAYTRSHILLFSKQTYAQMASLKRLDVVQNKWCTEPWYWKDKHKSRLWLPPACNLWERNHKINFTVMQKDEMTHKLTISDKALFQSPEDKIHLCNNMRNVFFTPFTSRIRDSV